MTDLEAKAVCLQHVDLVRETETAWDALISLLQLLDVGPRRQGSPQPVVLAECHRAVERVHDASRHITRAT